jgi:hypothetical protein
MASHLAAAGADANFIMAQGRWKTAEAMSGYARVDPELAHRAYDETMKRVRERRASAPKKKALSLEQLLEYTRKVA